MNTDELKVNTVSDEEEVEFKGKFFESLNRNNRTIKKDRAISITEDAHQLYQRTIEDMERSIKKMKRDRANMLDLNPSDANSLVVASDFDAAKFVEKDLDLGVKIRNLQIRLEIAKESFTNLFG